MAKTRFALGSVYATPGALAEAGQGELLLLLLRHQTGDWGDLSADDRQANEDALADGSRILSAYRLKSGGRLYVITEATNEAGERWSTTALLPSEY